jgi:PPOX class probable F420-dependent enzyme
MAALDPAERAFLVGARTGVLATLPSGGAPSLVPICFVVGEGSALRLYTPLDDKPKRVADARNLARVRNIEANPMVSILVDRWSEDWSWLGWLRLDGRAELIEPGFGAGEHAAAVAALRAKYPQYASHRLDERPIIRITIERSRSWGNLAAG